MKRVDYFNTFAFVIGTDECWANSSFLFFYSLHLRYSRFYTYPFQLSKERCFFKLNTAQRIQFYTLQI